MSESDHKSLVRDLIDALRADDVARHLSQIVTAGYVEHGPAGETNDLNGVVTRVSDVLGAFPDLAPRIEVQISEGDLVATRAIWTGTHTEPFQDVAPTRRKVQVAVHRIERVADGRIAETWIQHDGRTLKDQIA